MTGKGIRVLAPFAAALALICLGARPVNPTPDGHARGPGATATRASTLIAPASALARAPCAPVSAKEIAEGRRIFTGAGNCYTCHGPDAKGTALAPSLHEHKWLNVSGSYESIAEVVTTGVPHPKEHPAPMPPKGGANLSGDQVCDVAAYVYSISHPK